MNAYILYKLVQQMKKMLRLKEGQEYEVWKVEGKGVLFRVLKNMFKFIDRWVLNFCCYLCAFCRCRDFMHDLV